MIWIFITLRKTNERIFTWFSKLGKELGPIDKNLPERFDLSAPLVPFSYLNRFIVILKEQILALSYNSNSYYNK